MRQLVQQNRAETHFVILAVGQDDGGGEYADKHRRGRKTVAVQAREATSCRIPTPVNEPSEHRPILRPRRGITSAQSSGKQQILRQKQSQRDNSHTRYYEENPLFPPVCNGRFRIALHGEFFRGTQLGI
jgi:hypothetical protein